MGPPVNPLPVTDSAAFLSSRKTFLHPLFCYPWHVLSLPVNFAHHSLGGGGAIVTAADAGGETRPDVLTKKIIQDFSPECQGRATPLLCACNALNTTESLSFLLCE